ncbi:MAG: adenylate/guanylate cyclase domain-containing protein [Planctomycetales bacterium]|nr:adenylate/guanylate cyclase domain-containing protein [Planctomycetales bacterium]
MASGGTARREIDQTLRLSRDRVERAIAFYRLLAFGLVVPVSIAVNLFFQEGATWVPTLYFSTVFGFALALRVLVRRVGARPSVVYGSVLLDLSCSVGIFFVMSSIEMPLEARRDGEQFVGTVCAPALLSVLLINTIRNHHRAAVLGGAVAALLFVLCLSWHRQYDWFSIRFGAPHFVATSLLGIAGVVGWFSANEARKTLETHARVRLLGRYLPEAAVRRVVEGDPEAALALGGQLRTVTLLSSDLREFTAMSERLPPTEVVEQLNAYHGAMYGEVERHGGVLDKFMGDGALVVFGVESPGGGDANDHGAAAAVGCARAMVAALAAHNRGREARGLPTLRMGIGIHTGSVVSGNIGAPGRRLEFTVIGDAVNTASRLEGLTKLAGAPILASADTAALVAGDKGLRELPSMPVRGKSAPMRVFAVD